MGLLSMLVPMSAWRASLPPQWGLGFWLLSRFSRTCRGFVMGFISIGLGIWSLFSMPPPRTRMGTLHSIRYVVMYKYFVFGNEF